ncbi:hypothetical protein AAFF_G00055730 [Aldrovandia affinis]|uniref:Uncharacterized protein n=1 Tax=Aldrovandia affinis TaxID=143900 RepID=A0AAD7S0S1_9TELE|nr:hypothetical protein AAFF_G00055730 [Aldrovandia affinis]
MVQCNTLLDQGRIAQCNILLASSHLLECDDDNPDVKQRHHTAWTWCCPGSFAEASRKPERIGAGGGVLACAVAHVLEYGENDSRNTGQPSTCRAAIDGSTQGREYVHL